MLLCRFLMAARGPKSIYQEHLPLETIVEKLNNGDLLKSTLRIHQKHHDIAFLANPVKSERDILVEGNNQNRAFNGDLVAFEILPKENWKLNKSELLTSLIGNSTKEADLPIMGQNEIKFQGKTYDATNVEEKYLQKTAKVVGIIEKVHPRKAMGYGKVYNKNYALFSPLDNRVPRMLIPLNEFPKGFAERPNDFADNLMIGLVKRWELNGKFAMGSLLKSIGGDKDDLVVAATEGILTENDLDDSPFPDDIDAEIPDFEIKPEDVAKRQEFDFRKKCVFTIDPATARDLDDACSVEEVGDGIYEIGVHIADVSHFVYPGTTVDDIARERTTSVYLVQRVIPMLPRKLCENLCSLNPGVDRFSFSVVWKMRKDGTVLSTRFGKSLINSCCKLHYEHAQDMIEEPDRQFEEGYLPKIYNGYTYRDLSKKVNILHEVAQILRKKRKESGSISIQQCKIKFSLNRENGMPSGLGSYKSKESNKLIEEFMLKANVSVAEKLVEHYPDNAIIRRHVGPKENVLKDTKKILTRMGIEVDTTSSKMMQEALNKLQHAPNQPTPVGLVVASLLAKCMSLATYHSSGEFDSPVDYFHYGLSMELYTHFTSPIRRYPDLIAHRQLQAILEGKKKSPMDFDEVSELAELSSQKKYASKLASDKSGELFLWLFLREQVTMHEAACVVEIGSESIDVLVLRYGIQVRIWRDYIGEKVEFQSKEKEWAHITWPADGDKPKCSKRYELLDNVVVIMKAGKQLFKINGALPRPDSSNDVHVIHVPSVEGFATEDV
ncbi:hypothetical protein ACHWQZ_G006138 [Mnemiopsis leidyi]